MATLTASNTLNLFRLPRANKNNCASNRLINLLSILSGAQKSTKQIEVIHISHDLYFTRASTPLTS
jgi:hypothetical protein